MGELAMPAYPQPPQIKRPRGHAEIVRNRTDLSFFLVHLTKADHETDPAHRLMSILTPDASGFCTLNGTPQGYFGKLGDVVSDPELAELTRGVAFTEAPLDQIKHFALPIEAAGRQYSSFGLVFDQSFIRKARGNPCFYVNTWPDPSRRQALFALLDDARNRGSACRDLLLYFNIFGEGKGGKPLDFYWEREWRVPGDLRFRYEDIFVGLATSGEDAKGRSWVKYFSQAIENVPFIDPQWSIDEILRALRARRQ
jgi:hypothetical protein